MDKLYNEIVSSAPDLKPDEMKKVCIIINNLPDEHLEIIYALMLHHATIDPSMQGMFDIRRPPYSGKTFETGKGVLFKLNMIPAALQKVIGHYVNSVSNTSALGNGSSLSSA